MELENPELYDKNNPIYNDICHPYTSVDGLDMTLSGKQKDYFYILNNIIIISFKIFNDIR